MVCAEEYERRLAALAGLLDAALKGRYRAIMERDAALQKLRELTDEPKGFWMVERFGDDAVLLDVLGQMNDG